MDIKELNKRLSCAFKQMRKQGLFARQNCFCCSSCGGAAIANALEFFGGSGEKQPCMGACFYHKQDNARKIKGEDFYVTYGQIFSQKLGAVGLPSVEVGALVVKALSEAGVKSEWNGDAKVRIKIIVSTS